MRRIGVGVQKADRDRLDACVAQLMGDGRDLLLVERPEHLAGGIDPFVDLERQVARESAASAGGRTG